jgi:hypothetical protein
MNEPMAMKDVIEQLGNLRQHCLDFKDKDDLHGAWATDVAALDITLPILRELFRQGIDDAEGLTDVFYDYNRAAKDHQKNFEQFLSETDVLKFKDGTWHCPACRRRVGFHHTHCHWCGKKLDWRGAR